MIGIYQDSFKDYLIENLGGPLKISSSNIITRCPWCEMGIEKKHYHFWIGLETPIWHCFKPNCPSGGGGLIPKLIKKISGRNISDKFVDRENFKKVNAKKILITTGIKKKEVIFPDLKEDLFLIKTLYMKKRLKFFKKELTSINGVVFDIKEFVRVNDIKLPDKVLNMVDFLHSNFVGIVTKHQTCMVLRNIEPKSSFSYFKMQIQNHDLLDYYKLKGTNINSNTIVLAEGIFDILTEQIFRSINVGNVRLYAAGLSVSYDSLLKSVIFDEQLFRPDIHILSDRDVHINYYKKLKRNYKHCINSLNVYYNKCGKDFNDTPVFPERFII